MNKKVNMLNVNVKEVAFLGMILILSLVAIVPTGLSAFKDDDGGLLGIIDTNIDITDSWEAKYNSRANAYVNYSIDGKTPSYYYINSSGMLAVEVGPYIGTDNVKQPAESREIKGDGFLSMDFNSFKSGSSSGFIILNIGITDSRSKPFGYYNDPKNFQEAKDFADSLEATPSKPAPKPAPKPSGNVGSSNSNTSSKTIADSSTKGTSNNDNSKTAVNFTEDNGQTTQTGEQNETTRVTTVKQEDLPEGIEITDSGFVDTETGEVVEVNLDTLNAYSMNKQRTSDYYNKNINDIDVLARGGEVYPLLDDDNDVGGTEITLEGAGQEKFKSASTGGLIVEWFVTIFSSFTNTVKALF